MENFKSKKIAVIGVSHQETKFGYKIFKDLVNNGFKVYGVNPKNGEILGRKIYRKLKELEVVPDLVITVVPPKVTEEIVEECKELGVKEIWMQPGSESPAAIEKAERYGISVIYNACFMIQTGIW